MPSAIWHLWLDGEAGLTGQERSAQFFLFCYATSKEKFSKYNQDIEERTLCYNIEKKYV